MSNATDLHERLAALVAGRREAGDRIVAAARAAGIGAVLVIGSLGRCDGDAFSDLDLLLVPAPGHNGVDLTQLFGPQIVAELSAPRNAPTGGAYTGLCLDVAEAVLWLDVYEWPAATAAIPADAVIIYDTLTLPYSQLGFVSLITHYADPTAPAHPPTAATTLLRVAVAAKYLARGDRARLLDKLPDAAGLPLDAIGPLLHQRLAAIDDPALTRAITGTAMLVDLADAARTVRDTR